MTNNQSKLLSMLMAIYSSIAAIVDENGAVLQNNARSTLTKQYYEMLGKQLEYLKSRDIPAYRVDQHGFTWAFFPLSDADKKLLVCGPISVMSFYVRFTAPRCMEGLDIPVLSWDVMKTLLKAVAYELYNSDFNVEPLHEEKDFDGLMSADEYFESHEDVSEKLMCAVRFLHFAKECISLGNYDDLYMLIMDDAFTGFITMLIDISRVKTLDFFAFAAAQCCSVVPEDELPIEGMKIYSKYMDLVKVAASSEEIITYLRKMLLEYVSYSLKNKEFSGKSSTIRDVVKYINANVEKDISTSSIAENIHISQGHLLRLFKQEFGISLNDYIRKKKLERACIYLKFLDHSVADISQKLSFCNQSYFSSCFKKVYGMSPNEYRKQVSCCIMR